MHLVTCTSKSLTYLLIKQHAFYLFEVFKPPFLQLLELGGFLYNRKKKIYFNRGVSFGKLAMQYSFVEPFSDKTKELQIK